jgi:hypothetical protein
MACACCFLLSECNVGKGREKTSVSFARVKKQLQRRHFESADVASKDGRASLLRVGTGDYSAAILIACYISGRSVLTSRFQNSFADGLYTRI